MIDATPTKANSETHFFHCGIVVISLFGIELWFFERNSDAQFPFVLKLVVLRAPLTPLLFLSNILF